MSGSLENYTQNTIFIALSIQHEFRIKYSSVCEGFLMELNGNCQYNPSSCRDERYIDKALEQGLLSSKCLTPRNCRTRTQYKFNMR